MTTSAENYFSVAQTARLRYRPRKAARFYLLYLATGETEHRLDAQHMLGVVYQQIGRYTDAGNAFVKTYDLIGASDLSALAMMLRRLIVLRDYAALLIDVGELEQAQKLLATAIQGFEQLATDDASVAVEQYVTLGFVGRAYAAAIALDQDCLEISYNLAFNAFARADHGLRDDPRHQMYNLLAWSKFLMATSKDDGAEAAKAGHLAKDAIRLSRRIDPATNERYGGWAHVLRAWFIIIGGKRGQLWLTRFKRRTLPFRSRPITIPGFQPEVPDRIVV